MTKLCTNPNCSDRRTLSRNGTYRRKSDRKTLRRYRCRSCSKTYSAASWSFQKGQKKRHLNNKIWTLAVEGSTQRAIARILRINRKTVVRKLRYLALRKGFDQLAFLQNCPDYEEVYVDEMKSFIHTKCRPVSIAMAVSKTRKILGFQISHTIPNSPRLIEIATRKYGPPKEESFEGFRALVSDLRPIISRSAKFVSDEKPSYPSTIRMFFPKSIHETHKSRRAVVAGQEELKEKGFDPLFPINHTFAMCKHQSVSSLDLVYEQDRERFNRASDALLQLSQQDSYKLNVSLVSCAADSWLRRFSSDATELKRD